MGAEHGLLEFFKSYGEAFDDGDRLATFYGDFAVASAPQFVGCLKGREEVRAALKSIAEYQIQTGMVSLSPVTVDWTAIDSLHSWAKVRWGAKFKKTGARQIEFDISYLLRRDANKISILLYISHQDEQKLREELSLT